MSRLPEPDHVDFFIDSGGLDPEESAEMEKAIAADKNRPEHRFEVEEAERNLAALGINFRQHGMRDAKSLLEHWHKCVADLTKIGSTESPGANGHLKPSENHHGDPSPDVPREERLD